MKNTCLHEDSVSKLNCNVSYNLVFLFNVGPGFFFRNVGEICAMLAKIVQMLCKLCNVVQKLICPKLKLPKSNVRRHCTGFSPVQCCLVYLKQHCTGFLPVQCCPKNIKTTLKRMCVVVLSLLDNIAQSFCSYLCNVILRGLIQH